MKRTLHTLIAVVALTASIAMAQQLQLMPMASTLTPQINTSTTFVDTKMKPAKMSDFRVNPVEAALVEAHPQRSLNSSVSSVNTVEDLVGDYVMTNTSAAKALSLMDNGGNVRIEKLARDRIRIINFGGYRGVTVEGTVDMANRTISFERQALVGDTIVLERIPGDAYQNIYNHDAAPILASIEDDGSIRIKSWVIHSTVYLYDAVFESLLERANGTFTTQYYTARNGQTVVVDSTYSVVVAQNSRNRIEVKNFGDQGYTIQLNLKEDHTCVAEDQIAYRDINGDYGVIALNPDWTMVDGVFSWTGGNTILISDPVVERNRIVFHDWFIYNTEFGHVFSINKVSTITSDVSLSFPSYDNITLDGEGTAESPYLVRTPDDLMFISDDVASNHDVSGIRNDNHIDYEYIEAYTGVYFRLENDIDMQGIDFIPIGKTMQSQFNGTFDGNGHTISNLKVNVNYCFGGDVAGRNAGLFGTLGAQGVVRNLTLAGPQISSPNPYCGSIVGMSYGHVQNCRVIGALMQCESLTSGGVVGSIRANGSMNHCFISDSNIRSSQGFGAVAGTIMEACDVSYCGASNVDIDCNCYDFMSGQYETYRYFGGFANQSASSLTDCYFIGDIRHDLAAVYSGYDYIGGLVSETAKGADINRCFVVADITARGDGEAIVGGLVGHASGTVWNSYSSGRIKENTSIYYLGSLVGWSDYSDTETETPAVANCYTNMLFMSSKSMNAFGRTESTEMMNVYVDRQMPSIEPTTSWSGVNLVTTSQLTSKSIMLPARQWTLTNGFYPMLKGYEDIDAVRMAASSLVCDENESFRALYSTVGMHLAEGVEAYLMQSGQRTMANDKMFIENDSLCVRSDAVGNDTVYLTNGVRIMTYPVFILKGLTAISFDGEGNENNPYLIKTKQDLINLQLATSIGQKTYEGKYFKMCNDIDLEYDPQFGGISQEWDAKFAGTFDGDGHTVSHMKLGNLVYSKMDENGKIIPNGLQSSGGAFVWYLDKAGKVCNMSFRDIDVSEAGGHFMSTNNGFAAVALQNYGVIDNCRNYSDLKMNPQISPLHLHNCGGIAGYNRGLITNCYNEGDITGGATVGGIAGQSAAHMQQDDRCINNCVNVGRIEGLQRVGGITGQSQGDFYINTHDPRGYHYLQNVINFGTVISNEASSSKSPAAGIVANCFDYSLILNAIHCGTVMYLDFDTYQWGAMVGDILNNWNGYPKAMNACWDNSINPDPTSPLSTVMPMNTNDLTDGRVIDGFETDVWLFDNGMYPVIKQFASEPAVVNARKTIVYMPAGQDAMHLKGHSRLAQHEGLTWTLMHGDSFKIEGDRLTVPRQAGEYADTLVATFGRYTKMIPLFSTGLDRADVNGDGVVDIADVNIVINAILGKDTSDELQAASDVTGDGVVDIADVNAVINAVLGK